MKKIIATISAMAIAMIFCLTPMITRAEADVEVAEETEVVNEGITEDDALNIAIKNAGFSESSVKYPKVWEDTVAGTDVYKVEFSVGAITICYHIDKASGDIITKHVDD